MPGLQGPAAPGLRTDEVWRQIARENTKSKTTNDTVLGCDQSSTGYGPLQQPRGTAFESSAEGVLGEKWAFEFPILSLVIELYMDADPAL